MEKVGLVKVKEVREIDLDTIIEETDKVLNTLRHLAGYIKIGEALQPYKIPIIVETCVYKSINDVTYLTNNIDLSYIILELDKLDIAMDIVQPLGDKGEVFECEATLSHPSNLTQESKDSLRENSTISYLGVII